MKRDFRRAPAMRAVTVASLALAVLAMSGCGKTQNPARARARRTAADTGNVVLAVAWPLSVIRELRFADGVRMGQDEINASGGIGGRKLQLEFFDDKGTVDEGQLVAQRIANDPRITAVIGHLHSHISVPTAAIYDAAGVVMIAPMTTDPELTQHAYRRVFRGTFTDPTIGAEMARYSASHGYKHIAVFYVRDQYGRNLANAFEHEAAREGLEITARQAYDAGNGATAETFRPLVDGIKPLALDAIFVAGEIPSAGSLIAAIRNAGIALPILGGDAMSSGSLAAVAGRSAEGTVVATTFHSGEPRAEVRAFARAFDERYHADPDDGAALGYDAVKLLAYAVAQAKSAVPDSVAAALHRISGWRGVTGTFAFDSLGNLAPRPVVKTVLRGGRFEYLEGGATVVAVRP